MSNELIKASAVSGGTAIASYTRDGLYIPTSPIEEYVTFRAGDFTGTCSFVYPASDLRIISIQADSIDSKYGISFYDPSNVLTLNHIYQSLVIDPNFLLLPKNYKCTLTPLENVRSLLLIAKQVSTIASIQLFSR